MLTNKKIVIVGGTTGMGLAATQAFVANGAQVVAVGRDVDSCQAVQLQLKNCFSLSADACEPDTAQNAITLCQQSFGGFDGLYHVAGGSGRQMGWNYTFSLNLTSLMLSNQAAVRAFLAQGTGGSILNMSSVLGYSPSITHFTTHAYAAAKAAVFGFSKSIAAYYASNNIRVNVVAPALVETPMAQRAAQNEAIMAFIKTKQPLDGGRIGHTNDLNGAALYFMSDCSKFTTGQILSVDGGWGVSEGQESGVIGH
jgi:NAD(P)-dependent dehydrogenase (short-subunit alcohol dehydrogenase family)